MVISFLIRWMHQDCLIDKKEFLFVFVVNLLLAPVKVVYGLFCFLYWFIPEERFGGKKNKIIATLILIAPTIYQLFALLAPLFFRIFRKIFETLFMREVDAETLLNERPVLYLEGGEVYTFSYVMNHPMEAIGIILRTIRYGLKNWFYASFGRALSGDSLILPTVMVHSLLAIIIISIFREGPATGNVLFRICILILCGIGGMMIVCGMLISWTEIKQEVIEAFGGPIIQGVQGRYFSPFLPYLFIIPNNDRLKISKKLDPYILFAFILLVFEIVVYVLSYTFIN